MSASTHGGSREVSRLVQKRGSFYDTAARMTPFLGTRAGQGLFLVRTEDANVGRSLFCKQGRGEMDVVARAATVLRAIFGDEAVDSRTFIDVGANIGTTTVSALLEQEFGRGVALEPEDVNFVTLRVNLLLNGVEDRVTAVQIAASDHVGTLPLVVDRTQGGKHWVATDDAARERALVTDEIVEIPITTLDELARQGVYDPDQVGLLWIDAQGHEGHILEGATSLLSRGTPIVVEWDPAMLDKVGDRGRIERVAAESYTHFAAMRADRRGDGPKYWMRPASGLVEYAERFLGPRTESLNDVLFVRLPPELVPDDRTDDGAIDLSAVIRRQVAVRPMRPEVVLDELSDTDRVRAERDGEARVRSRARGKKASRAAAKRSQDVEAPTEPSEHDQEVRRALEELRANKRKARSAMRESNGEETTTGP